MAPAKIAEMAEPDRAMAERLHAIIQACAPALSPKTWYGMPTYAKGGKVICFFRSATKFKTRHATLGFSDEANLDEGNMWPTAFALKELNDVDEKRSRWSPRIPVRFRAGEESGEVRAQLVPGRAEPMMP